MLKRSYIKRGTKGFKQPDPFKLRSRLTASGYSPTLDRQYKFGLRRAGKKAKLRESINRPNRIRFAAMGLLDVCEARLPGCWPNGHLTWAHGKKDKFLTMAERKYLVIRACTVCHHKLDEEMSHEEMLAFVKNVIANRELAA